VEEDTEEPIYHRDTENTGLRNGEEFLDGSGFLYALVVNSRSFCAAHSESAESLLMVEKGRAISEYVAS
jgi:hypothetical protein